MSKLIRYTPRDGVRKLYGEFIDESPMDMDWSEFYQDEDSYDYNTITSGGTCEECGAVLAGSPGEYRHNDLNEDSDCRGYIMLDVPMMNYAYPISTDRVGGVTDAAKAIHNLNLCIVEYDGNEYMALTGGGMDFSWEIAEAYMRLGYLPPLHFANLPQMAGKRLDWVNRWIIAGFRQAIRIRTRRARYDLERLAELSKRMKERETR